MHLVQVSDRAIWDLDGGRHYELANPVEPTAGFGSYALLVRVWSLPASETTNDNSSSDYTISGDPLVVERANQQALSFWNYLVSQCKHNVTTDTTQYEIPAKQALVD